MSVTWKTVIVCVAVVVFTWLALHWLPRSEPMADPLLNGPPEFIILSLIAALSLYLREVNVNTLDVRYRIRHGQFWNEPPERKYQDEKLVRLRQTSDAIMVASPFMFVLIVAACVRIVWDCYSRFYYRPGHASASLYRFDILIGLWLMLTFIGLTIVHFVVRFHDRRLEQKIEADRV